MALGAPVPATQAAPTAEHKFKIGERLRPAAKGAAPSTRPSDRQGAAPERRAGGLLKGVNSDADHLEDRSNSDQEQAALGSFGLSDKIVN
jgi:hypothetical protein